MVKIFQALTVAAAAVFGVANASGEVNEVMQASPRHDRILDSVPPLSNTIYTLTFQVMVGFR